MAIFPAYWNGSGTTANWYGNNAEYSGYLMPRLVEAAQPLLSAAASARARLAALRPRPTPNVWRPLEFAWSCPSAAPRRTVVPRGLVSWIRAGTRRPL